MSTPWTVPSTFFQYCEPDAESVHAFWNNTTASNLISLDRLFSTSRDIHHISRSPKTDITNKSYFLRLTNFNFKNLPNTISGIELRMHVNRFGRVTDDTIQLCLNENLIGENKAGLNVSPEIVYGNLTDLWSSSLSNTDVANPTFGVVVRFKAHPKWPHKSSPFIKSVELRIH